MKRTLINPSELPTRLTGDPFIDAASLDQKHQSRRTNLLLASLLMTSSVFTAILFSLSQFSHLITPKSLQADLVPLSAASLSTIDLPTEQSSTSVLQIKINSTAAAAHIILNVNSSAASASVPSSTVSLTPCQHSVETIVLHVTSYPAEGKTN